VSKNSLKFALIGCGYIGRRYVQLLSDLSECELTALVDTDRDRQVEYGDVPIPFFSSTEDYLNSDIETDAAIVATPNGTHAEVAITCLQKNKHVLIEKPMALKSSDAEAIIETAKAKNKKVMVVLQNRCSPVSVWLKEMVASKKLGRIFLVEVNCFWNRDQRYYKENGWHGTREMDGGSLFTQFSHFIDSIYWLFGDIGNVRSQFNNFNHQGLIEFEDTGTIHFEFEQGGIGCMNFSTAVWDKSFEGSLTMIAEKGTIKVSGQYMDRVEYCHVKDYSLPVDMDKVSSPVSNHQKLVEAFVDAIKAGSPTNADDGLHSVDVIERIYAAAESYNGDIRSNRLLTHGS
jgi:UDP-N-acetyl-2-amino-2-deoxyglucuronate dehydrogenase